jgi:hypothetical protein
MRKKLLILWFNTLLLSSCAAAKPQMTSAQELAALEHPTSAITTKINQYYPVVLSWYQQSEQKLLTQGRLLSKDEQAIALHLGVKHPERVRVLVLKQFPLPEDAQLQQEAKRYGLGTDWEGGRTMGYAILLKPQVAEDQNILAHELIHVRQIERMGTAGFIKRYLLELEVLGYARSPLELEAYREQVL